MSVTIQTNAKAYSNALSRYAIETGKDISTVLAREGPDFRQELFSQFREIHPNPQSIYNAAKSRGFLVKRENSTFLVKTENSVSARALARATQILDGHKSDYFRWVGNRLAPVRFSGRTSKILQGGRTGRRFAASALRAYQLSPDDLAAAKLTPRAQAYGIRRLNLRALAVYLELLYRQRGAQGGTMAIQWLFKTWRKRNATQRAQLVQRSATNIPIGTVDFEQDIFGNLQTIEFNGFVPGTGAEEKKHGILAKVFSARAGKLLNAIQLHNQKLARQRGY